ncbi:MAG: hypothetical protein Q8P02_03170 [Candidatus Micrarchaeota archaeon]|nr:hypothetical protein [Candidatus Micrarchaeota archaeon]
MGPDAAFAASAGKLSKAAREILDEAAATPARPRQPASWMRPLSAAATVFAALLGVDLAFGFLNVPQHYLFAALVAASALCVLAWLAAVFEKREEERKKSRR